MTLTRGGLGNALGFGTPRIRIYRCESRRTCQCSGIWLNGFGDA